MTDVVGLEMSIELTSVGCALALADAYEKVTFEAGTDTAASESPRSM